MEIGCDCDFNKMHFIMQGEEKSVSKRKMPFMSCAKVPLLTTVTEDMTSRVVNDVRFMRRSFVRWRVVSEWFMSHENPGSHCHACRAADT